MKKQFKLAVVLILSLICVLISASPVFALNEGVDYSYMLGDDTEQTTIPKSYGFSFLIDGTFESLKLSAAEDLYIANDDTVYIADTGNNRIVKTDLNGKLLAVYNNEAGGGFNNPKGVYADKNGDIYIADTGNRRLVKLAQDGSLIKEFPRPESDLLSDDITYEPTKIMVCENGLIYVVMGKEFMTITQDNVFMGYLGSAKVPFSITNMLVNIFASDIQKKKLTKVQPSAYNNFTLGDDGIVYASANDKTSQLKKITSVGENIYEEKFYGEYVFNKSNVLVAPIYNDIAVDKNGIIFVTETNSRKIYQYDRRGNSISVFGGEGSTEGYFSMPAAIDIDSLGRVYVLDSDRGEIQVFASTKFMNEVLAAINLFENGEYDKAETAWNEIVRLNAGYPLAHDMLGAIAFKQKDYKASMEHYKLSGNQEKYGEAYGEMQHDAFTKNFAIVAVSVIAGIFLLFFGLSSFKKLVDKWNRQLFHIESEED